MAAIEVEELWAGEILWIPRVDHWHRLCGSSLTLPLFPLSPFSFDNQSFITSFLYTYQLRRRREEQQVELRKQKVSVRKSSQPTPKLISSSP